MDDVGTGVQAESCVKSSKTSKRRLLSCAFSDSNFKESGS